MNSYEFLTKYIEAKMNDLLESKHLVEKHRDALERLELAASVYGGHIDFDNLPHEEVVSVIKAFGGKWNKTVNCSGDKIDYVLAEGERTTIRCWAGEPPPMCKIVEQDELVPAQIKKVRKLVCPETVKVQQVDDVPAAAPDLGDPIFQSP